MKFCERLSKARKDSGLSQEHVAKALDMTRPTYFNLEQGLRDPSIEEVRKISELFGIRIEELVSGSIIPDKALDIKVDTSNLNSVTYKKVLLYILNRVGALPNVGETVLYKLLYFTETNSLLKNKKQLINESFYKLQYGPVPVSFRTITNEMISEGLLDIASGQYFMYKQKKYLPRVTIDSSELPIDALSVIDDVIERLSSKTATELSDLSHLDLPWIQANSGEIIDLSLARDRNSELRSIVGA